MTDILNKEIVSYDEALYLKEMGFDWLCTGYYHIHEGDDEVYDDYECVGWRGFFRNSCSLWRAGAPHIKAASLWYELHNVKPYTNC